MNEPATSSETERRSLAEAAIWRVHLAELGVDSSDEFEAWLAADPAHRLAWRRVEAPWNHFSEHAAAPELLAARRAALGDARRWASKRWGGLRTVPRRSALATAVVAIAAVWLAVTWLNAPDDFSTALGERRVVTLEDGSRISLDSRSEVRVRYSKHARELTLLHGQARFDVAHDVERPFSVVARDQKIIATGTAFNVDLAGPEVLVTLIEGRVVVLNEATGETQLRQRHSVVELQSGEQLVVLPAKPPAITRVNVERTTAWQNGQLMFDNELLPSVVARVSRYTTTAIVVNDPSVAAMRISGVFNTGDVQGFVDTLTRYLPVTALPAKNGRIELHARG